ncbi:MAG: hypothetical protein EPO55_19585 [Reyranella sp.]|uniref:FecR family protein n=1 Tax=Reyranella sp. TaxID=1929291 RepID=UPI0011F95FF2|nr:FecR domain-containing protein [Reyranella sp.]TAJ37115.1 MAG: hypothetical protein EPO55_19585 [Reyranella sp.]
MTRWGIRIVLMAFVVALAAESAWARVGVTSVTDGDPLGQPPAEPERVLRVGVDVQANEKITTKANDRAHVVFLDGTSLTIGPNSVLAIDKYVYDPNRKTGEMALSATRGAFRFVGGAISKNSEVTIKTPSATLGIRGGIVAFSVSASGATHASFLYGESMRVTSSQGSTQTATRNGSEITVPVGGPPTTPALIPFGGTIGERSFERSQVGPAEAEAAIQQQTTASQPTSPTSAPTPTTTTSSPTTQPVTTSIEEAFDRSGFGKSNSLLGPQLALTKGIRSDAKQDKPGQGGDKGASTSVTRLQRIAGRAITQQNIVFNTTATTKADPGNSAFGQAQGNSGNNKGKGKGKGNNN